MNVKKTALFSIIALAVIGCVMAAGCIYENTSSESTSKTSYDSNGNIISASGSFTINTEDMGKLTVSINNEDPVVGIWSDNDESVLYNLFGNASATKYDLNERCELINPESRYWGKVQGMDNIYLIAGNSSFSTFKYSPTDDTLSDSLNPDYVLTRTQAIFS